MNPQVIRNLPHPEIRCRCPQSTHILQTSEASTIHFDMLQLPNGERERGNGSGLSVIAGVHEDVSAGRARPSVN